MYTISYIFLISVIILVLLNPYKKKEHFIQRTLEFSDMAMDPINVRVTFPFSKDFFKVLGQYIPLIQRGPDQKIDLTADNLSNITMDYLDKKTTKYRFITTLFPKYLNIITSTENPIITYDDMLKDNTINTIYIFDYFNYKTIQKMLEILFETKKFKYIHITNDPKKLKTKAYYCMMTSEPSPTVSELSKFNKYFIIEFPEKHPVYSRLKQKFPSIQIEKYDIQYQNASNIKKIIYSIRDNLCLWSFDYVPEKKIYTLIKTIFENIESIRNGFTEKNIKRVMEYLRPEHMISISVIPIHPGVERYYRELQVYTYNDDPICQNTITTIKCQPKVLFENRYKLLNLYGTN